jgi:aerobic carbon-monoxide dehydrogenase small subunit
MSLGVTGPRTMVTIRVNGRDVTADIEPRLLLVDFIREVAGLTGTHVGCDSSNCGACTVLLEDRSVKSCTLFAVQASGSSVQTVEGLAGGDELTPLQQAFREKGALQCGYCTPGMLMSATYLLATNPSPTRDEIKQGMVGNLCRCTGYTSIVEAVEAAAERGEQEGHA